MNQKFNDTSRHKMKRRFTGRKGPEVTSQSPVETRVSTVSTKDPVARLDPSPETTAVADHGDNFDEQLQTLIEGMGTEIERVQAAQRAKIEALVSERRNAEVKLREKIAQSRRSAQPASQKSAKGDAGKAGESEAVTDAATARTIATLEAWLDDARRQNAALEHRVDARTIELGLAEKRVAAIEERERQALEKSDQLSLSLATAQADFRALFDRMGQRLSDFSRNAHMREAMARDEIAAERLQVQQDRVVEALRADQALVRQQLCAEAARLAVSQPSQASAILDLLKFDDDQSAIGDAPSFGADDPVDFLAARGPAAMTLAIDPSFEIAAAMRWADAEFIGAAYRWLLGRDTDHHGLASYTKLLSRGRLRQDVLVDIAQSAEAMDRLNGGSLVQIEDDQEFIHKSYHQLLGRAADAEGVNHYAGQLAAGVARRTIMMDMSASQEAQRTNRPLSAALRGIKMVNDNGYRLRQILRRWTPRFAEARRYASYAARIAAVECLAARRHRDTLAQLDALRQTVDDRIEAAYRLGSKKALASISLVDSASPSVSLSPASMGHQAIPVSGTILSRLLKPGASRTPTQIIQAIRAEIKELELN